MGKKGRSLLFLVLLAGVMLMYVPVVLARLEDQGTASQLLQVMVSTGAQVTEVEVRTSVETGSVTRTEDIDQAAAAWLKKLGVEARLNPGTREHDLYVQQNVTELKGIRLSFRMIGVPDNGRYTTHVVFSLKGKHTQLPEIEAFQKGFITAFREAGRVPQFSTCIRGLYSDKMSVDQQESKILSIFDALHAQELERLADDTVVSISGYTRLWEPHLKLNGQKMNLQVATHQATATGETWITVGTPIITAEY
ncbi:MAG TPA: YwmB family TATA-box binding protein [Candidatus Bathyarchaeia archaeon]|nr:YwmB family TATA-box binding protein [Candidatus Bathyarchaeia archaeon]